MTTRIINRRSFMWLTAATAATFYVPSFARSAGKKVLMLGGTNFVGPYIVKEGLSMGWDITLFNRGITNPQMFSDLRKIRGDRFNAADVNRLSAEPWDAVIDTWYRNPIAVKISSEALKDKTSHYSYVSSIAVYGGRNYEIVGLTEDAALPQLPPLPADGANLDYARNKIYAENIIRAAFPDSHSIYRAHMIFGVDPATGTLNNNNLNIGDRCYWIWRIDKGGNVLAPGDQTDTNQYTDVRDLAAFIVASTRANRTGAYNVFNTITMKELFEALEAIKDPSSHPNLIWVPASFIFENGLNHAPMWVSHQEAQKGFHQMSNAKATKAGLTLRAPWATFLETKQAFYKYHSNYDFKDSVKGIALARREDELLGKWMKELNHRR